MTDTLNSDMINGPINIVRMEGYVNGIKKIIYIFFDVHIPITKQTRCPNFSSLDIYQYLAINLSKSKNIIDFMFEENLSYTTLPDNMKSEMYIQEVSHFFNAKFNENIIKKKNDEKVNVRFHYIDVRDKMGHDVSYYINDIYNFICGMRDDRYLFNNSYIEMIEMSVNESITNLNMWHDLLFGDMSSGIKQYHKIVSQKKNDILKIIVKIKSKYKNSQVLSNMKDLFNLIDRQFGHMIDKLNEFMSIIDMNMDMIDVIQNDKLNYSKSQDGYIFGISNEEYRDFMSDIITKIEYISDTNTKLFANIMDIFFLRRFLDKDYIDHAIVYTGCAHSVNYIQHLMTKYDFKITHVSYSFEKDINKLNNHLKKYNDTSNRLEYEKNLYIPYLLQCSSMAHFPEGFE